MNEGQATKPEGSLFYDAFKASPIGIALEDLEGRLLFANPALCSILGFTEDELRRKHFVEFSPPEDVQNDLALFEQLRKGLINHYQVEKRLFRADGSLILGRLNISLLNERTPGVLVVFFEDITERRMVRDTLELVTNQMAIVNRCSRDLRYMWVNQGYAALIERPLDQIIGHTILEVVGKEAFDYLRHYFERALSGEKVQYENVVNYRSVGPRWISAAYTPTLDVNGQVDGWVAVLVDITERKRAELALRESEERFRLMANTAPVMIWMFDVNKLCTYRNQRWAEFTGRSAEEALGNAWMESLHPEDLPRFQDGWTQAFDRRQAFRTEYRLRRNDGEYRWILSSGVPRFETDGSFAGYIGSAIDVTEGKVAEEALSTVSQKLIEAQEQERSRLARELHDDISQRLALLALSLARLKQSLSGSGELERQIDELGKKTMEVGKDVQTLSHRLHSPKLELLGLGPAAASFCREFSDMNKVTVDFESENVPGRLPQEVSMPLFRVLQEALQNATKHSGARRFQVSLRGTANEIELTVRDSGIGFKPEDATRGRGLGLTSMKERLKLANGTLSIDSTPLGGTTICARVPFKPGGKA